MLNHFKDPRLFKIALGVYYGQNTFFVYDNALWIFLQPITVRLNEYNPKLDVSDVWIEVGSKKSWGPGWYNELLYSLPELLECPNLKKVLIRLPHYNSVHYNLITEGLVRLSSVCHSLSSKLHGSLQIYMDEWDLSIRRTNGDRLYEAYEPRNQDDVRYIFYGERDQSSRNRVAAGNGTKEETLMSAVRRARGT